MLSRLSVDNYALINHLDIEFPGDLVIITGETGAGKSILLGALSLLLGGKADAGVIKDTSRNCVVEAEFTDNDGKVLIIRRVLNPGGRSRSFVDDEPVTIEQLHQTASGLVDIHSQNQQLLLSDRKFRMSVLDSFCGLEKDVESCSRTYDSWQSALRQLEAAKHSVSESEKEKDFLEFQYRTLADASLREEELEELESEQLQLANSELLKENLSVASEVLSGDEFQVTAHLKEAESALRKLTKYLPATDNLADRLDAARIELKDISEEVAGLLDKVSFNPQRLEYVDNRLSLLYDLMRRHSVSNLAELIQVRDALASKLGVGVDLALELQNLEKQAKHLEAEYMAQAETIHQKRCSKSSELSELIQNAARNLEMAQALFEVKVVRKDIPGRDGIDDISFDFNANGGQPKDLSKCASGGELSRIMLCIKSLLCKYRGMPTVIFDEIDTGVSGSIADKMGKIIVEMGSSMQVMAITHLPQVASKGSAHFLVYKEGTPVPATHIRKLEGENRVKEIARMLSGASLTEEALANARVLMKE